MVLNLRSSCISFPECWDDGHVQTSTNFNFLQFWMYRKPGKRQQRIISHTVRSSPSINILQDPIDYTEWMRICIFLLITSISFIFLQLSHGHFGHSMTPSGHRIGVCCLCRVLFLVTFSQLFFVSVTLRRTAEVPSAGFFWCFLMIRQLPVTPVATLLRPEKGTVHSTQGARTAVTRGTVLIPRWWRVSLHHKMSLTLHSGAYDWAKF